MDIISLILYFTKKWKAALIVSILGAILLLVLLLTEFAEPIMAFTYFIYIPVILSSLNKLKLQGQPQSNNTVYSGSIEDQLQEVNRLLHLGLISVDEYDEQRKKILERM